MKPGIGLSAIGATAICLACPGTAAAQDNWPSGPVTIVVPYDPGGTTDNMVRVIASMMEDQLGSPVVVSNTSGGGGVVGMSAALSSDPDGQTVGMYLSNTLVGLATGAAPFTLEDIRPACMFGDASLTVTGKGGDGAFEDLNALLAEDGATLAIERGTLSEFVGLMINDNTPNDLKLVNAETGPEKNAAVMGGHISALITPTAGVVQMHEADQLRVLAVLSDERLASAPDLPTAKEQGLDVSISQSNGFMFPVDTPDAAVEGFCDALEAVTADEAFKESMAKLNVEVRFMQGQEYADYMSSLSDEINALAKSVGYVN